MTVISNIDERGINRNLRERYNRDSIYVSIIATVFKITKKSRFEIFGDFQTLWSLWFGFVCGETFIYCLLHKANKACGTDNLKQSCKFALFFPAVATM